MTRSSHLHHDAWIIVKQFIRFGCVGSVGFLVDWGATVILTQLINFTPAVILAYIIAATNNWCLNRVWTFRQTSRISYTRHKQWLRFILANIPGLVINRGFVLGAVWLSPTLMHILPLLLLAGAFFGMALNFFLCRHCVFYNCDEVQGKS